MSFVRALAQRWRARPSPDDTRWVVLDVESSGLDARRDRLLAIAAIAMHMDGARPRIAIGDSFEVLLRQPAAEPDKANILLHGIGVGAQRAGLEAREALEGFRRFIGDSPLIAFHAAFDEAMILRAFDALGAPRPRNPWLDLEPVAAMLHPSVRARSLDGWLAHMHIRCAVRHQAAADTMASAELLQKLWPAAQREIGATVRFAALSRLAAQRKWMPRS